METTLSSADILPAKILSRKVCLKTTYPFGMDRKDLFPAIITQCKDNRPFRSFFTTSDWPKNKSCNIEAKAEDSKSAVFCHVQNKLNLLLMSLDYDTKTSCVVTTKISRGKAP